MSAAACEAGLIASKDDEKPTPFSQQWVRLRKQQHIEPVMQASSWKSLYQRAVRRILWLHSLLRRQHDQAEQRESALRNQLDLAQARIRDLQLRIYGCKRERRGRWSAGRAIAPRHCAREASNVAHEAMRALG